MATTSSALATSRGAICNLCGHTAGHEQTCPCGNGYCYGLEKYGPHQIAEMHRKGWLVMQQDAYIHLIRANEARLGALPAPLTNRLLSFHFPALEQHAQAQLLSVVDPAYPIPTTWPSIAPFLAKTTDGVTRWYHADARRLYELHSTDFKSSQHIHPCRWQLIGSNQDCQTVRFYHDPARQAMVDQPYNHPGIPSTVVSDGEFRPYIAPAHEGQGAKWTIISHGILYTLADPQPGRQHPRWQEYLDNDRKLLWEGHCASRPRLWSHYYFKDRTSAHNEPFTKNPDKAWLRSLNAM